MTDLSETDFEGRTTTSTSCRRHRPRRSSVRSGQATGNPKSSHTVGTNQRRRTSPRRDADAGRNGHQARQYSKGRSTVRLGRTLTVLSLSRQTRTELKGTCYQLGEQSENVSRTRWRQTWTASGKPTR
ncbi:hypothetical protein C8039_03955 [Halogeometricum sp. wsp3]|nr:hypothetical protein C8039_03955 [Halogeometricum sp. wsp3]